MHTFRTGLSHRSTGTSTNKEIVGVWIYISQCTVSETLKRWPGFRPSWNWYPWTMHGLKSSGASTNGECNIGGRL